mmetsp:Transcript_22812/g.11026  ORF Transcript_22812/g.11026 Transcript_22812/m.11026 type:complete len:100 (-) Transcript_22812:281-580(-)
MMHITKLNPFQKVENLFNKYNIIFSFKPSNYKKYMVTTDWTYSVDISENNDEFLIKVELPEIEKYNIKIQTNNNILNISGERKINKDNNDEKYHHVEKF